VIRLRNLSSEGVSKDVYVVFKCLSFILAQSRVDRRPPAKVMCETKFSILGGHRDGVELGDPAGISNISFALGKISR